MSMKKLFSILAIIACVISCKKEQTQQGLVHFGVDFEGMQATKTAMTPEELLSSAQVNIYYADFSGLVASYKYSELPQQLYLPASEYRVDVLAGECAKESQRRSNFEQISYKGSTPFTVEGGKDLTVQVEAKVFCAVTKVVFDNTVSNNLKDGYTLSIGPDEASSLVYTSDKNGKPGYILVSDLDEKVLKWSFSGNRIKNDALVQKSGQISVEPGKAYELKIKYTLREGDVDFNIYVDPSVREIDDVIVFEPVSTGLAPSAKYEIWAGHATIHADVDESQYSDPSKIKFTYSSDGQNWSTIDADRVSEGVYTGLMKGLKASTEYTYKLVIDGQELGDPLTLTTDAAPAVPNGDFEETKNVGAYYEFYSPTSSTPEWRNIWWGSGNGNSIDDVSGSADMGFVICKPDTDTKWSGKQSACLQSAWALVKFAAGNLFTGSFGGLVGTKGGIVNFGRPFTARPTGLRFHAKYHGGKVNHVDSYPSGHPIKEGDWDACRVQFALGVWSSKTYGGTKTSPVQVNTTNTSTFVDYNTDPSTLAYVELVLTANSTDSHNTWKEYELKLNYRDEKTMPEYIIISCASSMWGDYFTGYDEAKLWIDAMEFIYD